MELYLVCGNPNKNSLYIDVDIVDIPPTQGNDIPILYCT